MDIPNKSPAGFHVSATHCGLKKDGKNDLMIIYSELPCQVAAVFTTNRVKAAPVLYDQEILKSRKEVRCIVANAGNANACTGDQGMQHTRQTAEAASKLIGLDSDQVLVLSTGVIGVPLPIDLVVDGIKQIHGQLSPDGWLEAAQAIMTTDTYPKIVRKSTAAGYSIVGIAKGSGMISPNMATMLSIICTDAALTPELMEKIPEIWDQTFNRIVVDGDMSTNDTVLLLANGASGKTADSLSGFYEDLEKICTELAVSIVRDGEGASKLVTVKIKGADDEENARKIANAIATSPLCKTAFYGADPNWGRIICAAGYANAEFSPEIASLALRKDNQEMTLFEYGQAASFNEDDAISLMQTEEWEIILDLHKGDLSYWVWTCDLSHEYITINGHYRT